MLVTSTGGFGCWCDCASAAVARGQSSGPEVARCTFHWVGSMNHRVAGPAVLDPWTPSCTWISVGARRSLEYTQPSMWSSASVRTTGSFSSPSTSAASATSNTAQLWVCGVPASSGHVKVSFATWVRRGSVRAASIAACEVAM